ncbi:OCIA domain-containing protein 1-like isoform X1 [Littorina saxatilis]|uniref:OCIA domain-containing protein n=1 Tax=Littorina saxatilis TaxID=31220 RepID=A0AAN9B135_9CAEN
MASGPSSGPYSGTQQAQGGEPYPESVRSNPHLPQPKGPRLSQEEIKVLQECTQESFWYRCVPLAMAFGGATAYLFKAGYIKPSPRWGTIPKTSGAVFIAYILGKLSYQPACQQKILEKIPDSNLAQSIRKSRGMETVYTSELSSDAGPEMGFIQSKPRMREEYSSMDSMSASGDSRTGNIKELDDNQRPSMDREVRQRDDVAAVPQRTLTYEELRQQNRLEHERTLATSPNSPFRQRPFPAQQPSAPSADQPPPQPSGRLSESVPRGRKNIYGDVID